MYWQPNSIVLLDLCYFWRQTVLLQVFFFYFSSAYGWFSFYFYWTTVTFIKALDPWGYTLFVAHNFIWTALWKSRYKTNILIKDIENMITQGERGTANSSSLHKIHRERSFLNLYSLCPGGKNVLHFSLKFSLLL